MVHLKGNSSWYFLNYFCHHCLKTQFNFFSLTTEEYVLKSLHLNTLEKLLAYGWLFSSSCQHWGPSGPTNNVENPFGKFGGDPFGTICGNLFQFFLQMSIKKLVWKSFLKFFLEFHFENFTEIRLKILQISVFENVAEIH